MPLSGDGEAIWKRHAKWIREVRSDYNGRLIVGVVTKSQDENREYSPVDEVIAEFEGLEAEFVIETNHRVLGEGATYLKMLEKIKTENPDEVFFYGHTKGITKASMPLDSPPHLWAEAMFDTVIRNREEACLQLGHKGVTGSFRIPGKRSRKNGCMFWHYSGTFFAARSAEVFRRDWNRLTSVYGCVERWPGEQFEMETQSGCLFLDNPGSLYDAEYWKNKVTPSLNQWRANGK